MTKRYSHRTVTDEQDRTVEALGTSSECGAEGGSNRPSNGTPEDLVNQNGLGGEFDGENTEVGGTSLGNNNILGLEELAHLWPEPCLGDDIVFLDGDGAAEGLEAGERRLTEAGELRGEFWEELLHAESGVLGVLDQCVIGVELKT